MTTLKLSVSGMSCQGCADSLKRAFENDLGISGSSISFEKKSAIVDFDSEKVSRGRLVDIVETAGFSVVQ